MRTLALFTIVASLIFAQQPAVAASAVGEVRDFGPDLSTTCNLPEGIAVDPRGNVYASSLNFGSATGPANICVLDRSGDIIDVVSVAPVPGGVARLLGMLYVPGEGLYVGDIGGGRVLRIDVRT